MLVENILIKRVGEVVSGVSPTTGKTWTSRSILLGWEDETGEAYINAQVDDDVWKSLGHQEGDTATLNLRFRTKAYRSGYITNDIRIIKEPSSALPYNGER